MRLYIQKHLVKILRLLPKPEAPTAQSKNLELGLSTTSTTLGDKPAAKGVDFRDSISPISPMTL